MKNGVIFVGTKFLYNDALREYALRKAKEVLGVVEKTVFFKDGDKELFLELEGEFEEGARNILFASKQNFPTIGKILCTITEDNLVLKEDSLIPSKAELYAKNSYVVRYNGASLNALALDEEKKMPEILLQNENDSATVQLFG